MDIRLSGKFSVCGGGRGVDSVHSQSKDRDLGCSVHSPCPRPLPPQRLSGRVSFSGLGDLGIKPHFPWFSQTTDFKTATYIQWLPCQGSCFWVRAWPGWSSVRVLWL